MKTKVEPTVEKWEEDFEKEFGKDYQQGSCLDLFDFYDGGIYQDIKDFIRQSVQEAKAELAEYCEHQDNCILSYWSGGRLTENGGYESKYGEKWYQSRPVDKTPKCTCGLDNLLTSLRKERGEL